MDPRRLVLNLEKPYSAFSSDTETAEDVLLAGLRWRSSRWTALAVSWISQGAPISEDVANELEHVVEDKHLVQKVRQEAFAAARKWRRAKTKAEPGASPNGGPAQRPGISDVSGGPPSVS
jgi:hypothetical protein